MEIGIFLLFFIVKNDMIMSDFKYKGEIKMQCPKCGSTNLQSTTETNSTGKDFSASKGCCGAILLVEKEGKSRQQHIGFAQNAEINLRRNYD